MEVPYVRIMNRLEDPCHGLGGWEEAAANHPQVGKGRGYQRGRVGAQAKARGQGGARAWSLVLTRVGHIPGDPRAFAEDKAKRKKSWALTLISDQSPRILPLGLWPIHVPAVSPSHLLQDASLLPAPLRWHVHPVSLHQ